MSPITNLLVATDFSQRAERAVARAVRLAQTHGATLHLVHVMDKLLLQMFGGTVDEHPLANEQRLVQAMRDKLSQIAQALAGAHAIKVEHDVMIGRVHHQVADYAKAHAIDLSVFGAHGENFLRDVFLGSTASKFLRTGHQPTLVVRSDQGKRPYRQVLVAVDFSPASRLAVEWALRIAPQATIHVVNVSELPFEGKMRYAGIDEDEIAQYRRRADHEAAQVLDAFLRDIEGTARLQRSITNGSPARAIVALAQARDSDLVVMGKRGRLEFDEFLLGSVTLRVLEEIDRDLLLVAPTAAP